ncbi:MAG: primosomal protein N' [Anaerolineae bacterium]|nr:primosomal protein N' [Anaerolineae bacterium]
MVYAEVAVNAPVRWQGGADLNKIRAQGADSTLGMTFHYTIPPELEGRLTPGHLVIVPFGSRREYGVVVALSDSAPVAEVREVEELARPDPVLLPVQIELARWMSVTYLAPLIDCLRQMLPPGLLRRARLVIEPAPDESDAETSLTAPQRALLDLLRREGPLTRQQIRARMRRKDLTTLIERLVQRGVLVKRWELPPPRIGPRRVRFVRLLADEAQIAAALPHLGNPSKQADVLLALAASDDPLPTLQQVCAWAHCTPATVQALARRGWVEITPRRNLVSLAIPSNEVDHALEELRSARQAAVLTCLRRLAGPADVQQVYRESGANSAILRALEKRGLVHRTDEEPHVLLRLDEGEIIGKVLELRRGERQAAVLRYLQDQSEAVWVSWVYAETGCSLADLRALEERGLIALEEQEMWRDPLAGREFVLESQPRLTPDQEAVWQRIRPGLQFPLSESTVYLLRGVTGSGKTEIYLRALQEVLAQGRQGIVLVPEIALTPQTIRRFAARFPARIAVLHSGLSAGERFDTWRRIRAGLADVVIGPRSALFAPLPRLGLIVIDEEHEVTYKQTERPPGYHAREVAIELARLSGAAVIMGSATPDLTSYHRARQGQYTLLELPQRILGHRRRLEEQRESYHLPTDRYRPLAPHLDVRYTDLPPVRVVDMRQELRAGNRSIFSRALQTELARVLQAGQQAILFLNRRGTATFVLCRDCGHVLRCPRCDVPLTYHATGEALRCHHCGRREPVPRVCPRCRSPRIRYFGIGTERVEATVKEMFPRARTLRWDRDTTTERGSHEAFLQSFVTHQADVLVGTQMIAKGLDLPLVTLVGVVAADTALYLPDFRSSERTFQLLTQVAGRAGRSPLGGQVIVQTYAPEHYAIQAAAHHDYLAFYEREIAFRREHGYPPFSRLARLLCVHTDAERCQEEGKALRAEIEEAAAKLNVPVAISGPVPCFFARWRGQHRWQIIVRAADPSSLLSAPPLPPNWRVEVDPVDLL